MPEAFDRPREREGMTHSDRLNTARTNFMSLSKVIRRLLDKEMSSFQGFSGQFELYEDADGLTLALRDRLEALARDLEAGNAAAAVDWLGDVMAQLSQLDRLVVVAQLRGAGDASGDLLPKLRQWVTLLVGWTSDIREQVRATL
jgi:hypothetical protein